MNFKGGRVPRAGLAAAAMLLAAACCSPAAAGRGIHAVLAMAPPPGATMTAARGTESLAVLRRRLEALSGAVRIARRGDGRITVDLPGDTDLATFRLLFPAPVTLSFHLVDDAVDPRAIAAGRAPPGTTILPFVEQPGAPAQKLAVRDTVLLSGDQIVAASNAFDSATGMPSVALRFNSAGTAVLEEITRAHVGQRFAIVVDGRVVAAPIVREPILSGRCQIAGGLTQMGAIALARALDGGAVPQIFRLVSAELRDLAD